MHMRFSKTFLLTALMASVHGIAPAQNNNGYGKNILSVAPMAITDQGVGFGLGYERSLDSRGVFSISLPFTYSFRVQDDSYYGTGYYNRTEYMLYAYPGIKVYPTGAFGKVRYGVGPSLVIGTGEQYDDRVYSYPYPGPYYPGPSYASRFVLGTMIHNSLNINPTNHLYLGLELGLGITYMNRLNNHNIATDPLVQTSFRIGYRF